MNAHLTPGIALGILIAYFLMLIFVAHRTSRGVKSSGFFLADRSVKWWVVAFAMIGTSISGVTFISIPGKVGGTGLNMAFSYMQLVLGYLLGYLFVGAVLMPMYYRLQLTSIYEYLGQRFGTMTHRTGAAIFLIARTFGSAARMFLAAVVLQSFIFGPLGFPFFLTAMLMLALIYVYTYKGGLKTIIWTDTIMTACLLFALVWTVGTLAGRLNLSLFELPGAIARSSYSQVFFFDNFWSDPNHFIKQFISGALIVVVMTGLDQDLMQKNLACRNIREAQKNMAVFCLNLVVINLLFLTLGALLYLYATSVGLEIPGKTDQLYPTIAFQHLDLVAGIFFMIGLVASTYASSDSALTALTTSFCVDFLGFEKQTIHPDEWASEKEQLAFADQVAINQAKTRSKVHLGFSVAFVVIILALDWLANDAVINLIFRLAAFTYGPLLGLFMFGLFTRRAIVDKWSVWVCLAAPALTYVIDFYAKKWFSLDIGFLTLLVNGGLTFGGLWLLSLRAEREKEKADADPLQF